MMICAFHLFGNNILKSDRYYNHPLCGAVLLQSLNVETAEYHLSVPVAALTLNTCLNRLICTDGSDLKS